MTKFELIENMINNHFDNDGWNIYKFETRYLKKIENEVEEWDGLYFDKNIDKYMSELFTQYENNKQTNKGDDMKTKIEKLQLAYEASSAALTAFDRIADDMKAAPQSVKNAFYAAYEVASNQYDTDRKAYALIKNEMNALINTVQHNRNLYLEISAFFDNLKDDEGEGFTLPKTVFENLERSAYEAKMHWHDAEAKLDAFMK